MHLNLMGNGRIHNTQCCFCCYFIVAHELCNVLLLKVKFGLTD
jgi:hypothetical protein